MLFKTEWHKPHDGEGEPVLAQMVTRKLEAVSKTLEGLVPNPRFVRQPWRSLRGHVKFFNVNKSISHNIDKLFAAPKEVELNPKVKLEREDILFGILRHGLKTMTECIRMQTVGIAGLHIIQIDVYILRLILRNFVSKESEPQLDMLLDELMSSTVDRSTIPTPLEAAELEALCEPKLVALVGDD